MADIKLLQFLLFCDTGGTARIALHTINVFDVSFLITNVFLIVHCNSVYTCMFILG